MMYEFKEEDAYRFAQQIDIPTYRTGNNLHFKYCPYCRGGAKDTKTFAINLSTGQFKCLRASCDVSGNMVTLAKDFDFSLGVIADEYYRPKKQYRRLKTPKVPIMPKPTAIAYLESRGISEKVAREYEITVRNDRENVIVFPFYDEKGILQYVKYRDSAHFKGKTYTDKNGSEHKAPKEWGEANCKPILFGMKQCKGFSRLIICEGQMDSLSVAEAGIQNAVSVPNGANGFTWIPYCWNWINQFDEVIVFGDYENGKITLLDELSKRLKTTIKHVNEDDYKDCKDANEILQKYGKEQIIKCIDEAVTVPIRQVVDLADIKNVDIFKIPKLKTGIKQIDRLLYGGLPMGFLILVSGKAGEGKSTLASQILANAIDQGYKCFAYSGELPNYLFKAWIDFQLAGPHHVFEYENIYGDKNYDISKINKQTIAEWYRGKAFLYDNSNIDYDEKESILTVVENTLMQYGVKVILIDNLMTALDLETISSNDKNEKQSLFVKSLARLALRHNALILLVAHKRKNNFSDNNNDEVSGSSDISNLAAVHISYEKDKNIEESERLGKVTKNRVYGKVETKGYKLSYDERSKRIYGEGDDLYVEYGWNKPIDGFYQVECDTPFDD